MRSFDLHAIVGEVPLAIIRVMDLARALAIEPDVLLLDEMTAALPADLAEAVLAAIGDQRKTGRSVIFISHRLLEVGALCDRATVLRDGETVGVVEMGPGAEERIVELMLGPSTEDEAAIHTSVVRRDAPIPDDSPAAAVVTDEVTEGAVVADQALAPRDPGLAVPRLAVRDLALDSKLRDVTFDLRAGEVLGLVALEGQGQDELFGDPVGRRGGRRAARSRSMDASSQFRHPADAIAVGLVLVPGDRTEGLLMQRSVRENIALPYTASPRSVGADRHGRREGARAIGAIERLQIDTRAQGEVRRLSGGNQQKVTIARWIAGGVRDAPLLRPHPRHRHPHEAPDLPPAA